MTQVIFTLIKKRKTEDLAESAVEDKSILAFGSFNEAG